MNHICVVYCYIGTHILTFVDRPRYIVPHSLRCCILFPLHCYCIPHLHCCYSIYIYIQMVTSTSPPFIWWTFVWGVFICCCYLFHLLHVVMFPFTTSLLFPLLCVFLIWMNRSVEWVIGPSFDGHYLPSSIYLHLTPPTLPPCCCYSHCCVDFTLCPFPHICVFVYYPFPAPHSPHCSWWWWWCGVGWWQWWGIYPFDAWVHVWNMYYSLLLYHCPLDPILIALLVGGGGQVTSNLFPFGEGGGGYSLCIVVVPRPPSHCPRPPHSFDPSFILFYLYIVPFTHSLDGTE